MTVLVSLTPEHVRAIEDARRALARLSALVIDVGDLADPLIDQLGDILDLARAEERHSVDYRKVAEDGARLMAHDGPYPPDWPKNERYAGLVADVFDLREKGR